MIRYTEIIKAVKDKIKAFDEDAKIYSREVTEGYVRPCYFIDVLPISRNLEMMNRYNVSLLVVVSYFSNTENSIENYRVLDDLFLALQGVLVVGDRKLTVLDFTTDEIGQANKEFNISFSLKFKDSIPIEDNGVIAKDVFTKIKRS